MRFVLTAPLFGSFVFCTPATSHAIGDPDIRARITTSALVLLKTKSASSSNI
jgi:hypothetical protein